MVTEKMTNPYRPGAGHRPPFLAGRMEEKEQFAKLLEQQPVTENLILTGLRGVGKTVLLEDYHPIASEARWLWVGADISERSTHTEENLCVRLMTDLAAALSGVVLGEETRIPVGFGSEATKTTHRLSYADLHSFYDETPGLPSDKIKAVLRAVQSTLTGSGVRGIVFAYDEAQNLQDHSDRTELPIALLLEVFQSIQRSDSDVLMMLVLTGLPTLYSKLVESRTYSERMFTVQTLGTLSSSETREAILKPTQDTAVQFNDPSIESIWQESSGYPYFVQFFCREVFDVWVGRHNRGEDLGEVPLGPVVSKLDEDFFAGRWNILTERQRDALTAIAALEGDPDYFSIQDVAAKSKVVLDSGFSPSNLSQVFQQLITKGLVYKSRHGEYSLAVPLLAQFTRRQVAPRPDPEGPPSLF